MDLRALNQTAYDVHSALSCRVQSAVILTLSRGLGLRYTPWSVEPPTQPIPGRPLTTSALNQLLSIA